MNFTAAGVNGRDDVHVLALEHSNGWLYEVKIENHPIYDEHPYRSSQRYVSQNDALVAGRKKAEELYQPDANMA